MSQRHKPPGHFLSKTSQKFQNQPLLPPDPLPEGEKGRGVWAGKLCLLHERKCLAPILPALPQEPFRIPAKGGLWWGNRDGAQYQKHQPFQGPDLMIDPKLSQGAVGSQGCSAQGKAQTVQFPLQFP